MDRNYFIAFVLELRSKFPASEPSAPTSDGSWKTHALNLERQVAELQRKYEAEQIRATLLTGATGCLSLVEDIENTSRPGPDGGSFPPVTLTDAEGNVNPSEKSNAKKKKKKKDSQKEEPARPLNTVTSTFEISAESKLRLETVLEGLAEDLNILPTQRLSPGTLFSAFSTFIQICQSADSTCLETRSGRHPYLPNLHALQCQKTLLLSSAIRTLEAVARILEDILQLHINESDDHNESRSGKSMTSESNLPSSGAASSNLSARASNFHPKNRSTDFSRSIPTLNALNVLLCHLLSICAPILFPPHDISNWNSSSKNSDHSDLNGIKTSRDSTNGSQVYSSSEDQQEVSTCRHKPDTTRPSSQSTNFDNHLGSEKFLDALTLNIFSPMIHSIYPLCEGRLRDMFNPVATPRAESAKPPDDSDMTIDIRTEVLAFFKDALVTLASSVHNNSSFSPSVLDTETTLTDLTDYLSLLTTREVVRIYEPASSTAPSTSAYGQGLHSNNAPRNPTNQFKAMNTIHSKDPPSSNPNRVDPTASTERPTQHFAGTRAKNRVQKAVVFGPEVRDAKRSNQQHMQVDDKHIQYVVDNDDPALSHQRPCSYPRVHSAHSALDWQLHSDPLALSGADRNNSASGPNDELRVGVESSSPRDDRRRPDCTEDERHENPSVLSSTATEASPGQGLRRVQGLDTATKQDVSSEDSVRGQRTHSRGSVFDGTRPCGTNLASVYQRGSDIHRQGGRRDEREMQNQAQTRSNDNDNANLNQRNKFSGNNSDKNKTTRQKRDRNEDSDTRTTRIQRLAKKEAAWYLCAMLHVLIGTAEGREWREERTSGSREAFVQTETGGRIRETFGAEYDDGRPGNEIEDGIWKSSGTGGSRDIDGYDEYSIDGYGDGYGYAGYQDGFGKDEQDGRVVEDTMTSRRGFEKNVHSKSAFAHSDYQPVNEKERKGIRSRELEDVLDLEDSSSGNGVPDNQPQHVYTDATANSTRVRSRKEGGGLGGLNVPNAYEQNENKDPRSLLRKGMVDALLGLLGGGASATSFASSLNSTRTPHFSSNCSCSVSVSGNGVGCECGANVPGSSGSGDVGVGVGNEQLELELKLNTASAPSIPLRVVKANLILPRLAGPEIGMSASDMDPNVDTGIRADANVKTNTNTNVGED
ncbi:hypothetical protein VKT23_002907 [Stygiomarasmius scandens]|uniref:Uncharacterized protein n=1 Tax=Marasmiellus scandens TaxID=2682957 RepID=A0ABR1JVL0_9AGAR